MKPNEYKMTIPPFLRPFSPFSRHFSLFLVLISAGLLGCSPSSNHSLIVGHTMGTTYLIRFAHTPLKQREMRQFQGEIQAVLDEINRQMSIWEQNSEISRFNRAEMGQNVEISFDFAFVARRALEMAEITDGAFDPTIGALVNLWGFGPDGPRQTAPSSTQIEAARQQVGWRQLELISDRFLCKNVPGLTLDLGACAKGFAVDKIAEFLKKRGFEHFLVEIGGETRAFGLNSDENPWKIGILRPDGSQNLQHTLELTAGRAIATSGNYRNFYRSESGNVEAHILDPRTGEPTRHHVASVSVLANDCLTADALATALFVLGPEEGLPLLAANFPAADALFILRHPNGTFEETASSPATFGI